jgi:hypothetical protein
MRPKPAEALSLESMQQTLLDGVGNVVLGVMM